MAADEEEEFDEAEDPDESDQDDASAPETIPCPYCGNDVYDDAEVCPSCHSYISQEDVPSRKPLWIILGAIAALAVMAVIAIFSRG